MLMTPRISVLIPTFNRADFLPQSLDSILAQTIPPLEVIVIDDGSSDNTPEVLKSYDGRVQYIRKANGGKSTALNLGLAQVHGDYVWVMDDDNVALPFALERLVAPLESNPEYGMSFCNYLLTGTLPDGRVDVANAVETPLPEFPDEQLFEALLQHGCFIGGGALLVRTSVCRAVGPYDPALIRSQDFDMALRLSRIARAVRVACPTFYYRMHSGMRGTATQRFTPDQMAKKWNFYDITIFRKLLADTSDMPASTREAVRRKLAKTQFAVAYGHFENNELARARRYVLDSLKNDWLQPRRMAYLAATFLPRPVIAGIRAVKRAL